MTLTAAQLETLSVLCQIGFCKSEFNLPPLTEAETRAYINAQPRPDKRKKVKNMVHRGPAQPGIPAPLKLVV